MANKNIRHGYFFYLAIFFVLFNMIIIMCYFSYKNIITTVEDKHIYKNVFINEIEVSGLNKADAIKKLSRELQQPINEKIIKFRDKDLANEYEFNYKDLRANYNIKKAVREAYSYARTGNTIARYYKIIRLKSQPLKINSDYNLDRDFIRSKLTEIENQVYIKPLNAKVYRENGNFITVAGKNGRKLDLDKIMPKLMTLLSQKKSGELDLTFEVLKPEYDESCFDKVRDLLGTYTTIFTGASRNKNIINAAVKLNNSVIYPNEIFSVNDTLKPFTIKNGYINAPIIVNGKVKDGLGGGVCQVSTAVYNAVLYSELEVTERQNHSLKVGYINYGFDATLAGDYIDLKFKNTTPSPLLIESIINNNKLTINIYGEETRPKTRSIKFESALAETVPAPPETVIYTDQLPNGQKKVESSSRRGYRYKLYKIVYENNVPKERVLVNTSYYRPVRGMIKIGTKKSAQAAIDNSN